MRKKIVVIEFCGECKYFTLDNNRCWNPKGKNAVTLDSLLMPNWCPLDDAAKKEVESCQNIV